MTDVALYASQSVQLDGTGKGTVKMGPLSAREVWQPLVASVAVSTHVAEAQCAIYVGDTPDQRNFRDQTFTGSSGDSTGNVAGSVVKCGAYVYAVWTGGDPLATATLVVTGGKTV